MEPDSPTLAQAKSMLDGITYLWNAIGVGQDVMEKCESLLNEYTGAMLGKPVTETFPVQASGDGTSSSAIVYPGPSSSQLT